MKSMAFCFPVQPDVAADVDVGGHAQDEEEQERHETEAVLVEEHGAPAGRWIGRHMLAMGQDGAVIGGLLPGFLVNIAAGDDQRAGACKECWLELVEGEEVEIVIVINPEPG